MREQKLKALVKQYLVNIENTSEGGASSLYDSKISIGYRKYTVCLDGFSEDDITPGCSVATSFLVATH